MVGLLIVATIIGSGVISGERPVCPQLEIGQQLLLVVSSHRPACASMTVVPGEATQVAVDHIQDLALHLTGEGKDISADGFEFGRETLTIDSPGRYRIEITVGGQSSGNTPLNVPMSRSAVSLQGVSGRQAAENSATNSKRSGKPADILASLELWKANGDRSAIARTWLKLGDAVLNTDVNGARDAYERAYEMCHSSGELRCVTEAANNSGLAARRLSNFDASFQRFQEAAAGWRRLSSPADEGRTLSNLGLTFSQVGDYQQAIDADHRAMALLIKRDSLAYAKVLNNLGLCYLLLAQYDKAIVFFRKAIAIESTLKNAEIDALRARLNLGRAMMLNNQLQSAHTVLDKIVNETTQGSNPETRAFALNNMGQILLRIGKIDSARTHLKDALDLHRTLGDRRGEAIALHYLGVAARRHGDMIEARELLNHALQIRRDYGMRDDAADSLFELADLEFAIGSFTAAKSLIEEAIPLLEAVRSRVPGAPLRASFYARRRNLLDLLVAIAMRPDNKDAVQDGLIAADFGLGRSLLELVAEHNLSSNIPQELAARQIKIRRELNFVSYSFLIAGNPKKYETLKPRIETLIAEDEEIEAHTRSSIENNASGAKPLTSVRSLQDFLPSQAVVLEYHLGERASYLWLIRNDAIKAFLLPPRSVIEKQISATIELFGKVLERRRDASKQATFEQALHRLSATLLGKIRNTDLRQLVVLVLDGDLHRVPFAALQLSSSEYLGIHHDLVRVPSAAFLIQANSPRAVGEFPKSILAFYDPVFSGKDPRVLPASIEQKEMADPNFARLPFNEELGTISRLVPKGRRDLFAGTDASVKTLTRLPLEEYGILHFSTHAVINDEIPELSRLVLTMVDGQGRRINGFVLPHQLAELHLHDSLVVLSACDTALGKKVVGEGLIGFTSSLFSAGASQLVLTLSEVDAEASSSFLSEAYSHILGPRSTSAEHALTLARRRFLSSVRWSDPYYWSSFVLVGSPTIPQRHIGGRQE